MLHCAVTLRAGNKKEARKTSPERKNNKRKEVYSYGVTAKRQYSVNGVTLFKGK